jgi:hypothetical protein
MSKQYMTISNGFETITIKTNSERAIKIAIKKLNYWIGGAIKSITIKGNVIKYTYTDEPQCWGYWQPTSKDRVEIIENTFETAEVVEAPVAEVVEAPAAEAPVAEVVEAPAAEVVIEISETVAVVTPVTIEAIRAKWDAYGRDFARRHHEAIAAIRAAEEAKR